MIGWSSYLMSIIMFINRVNVHYYELYVNLRDTGRPPIVYHKSQPVPAPARSEVQSQGEHPNLAWLDPATKSDEYLNLMRTVAIPDYRSPPGNKGAHALRRIEGDTAHFLMVTFWES